MNSTERNKSGLFLMELIVALLFFCAVSAICIKIFVAGEKLSDESRYLTNASIRAQSVAQCVKNGGGDLDVLNDKYPCVNENGVTKIYFDKNFNPIENKDGAVCYVSVKTAEEQNGVKTADISVVNSETGEEKAFFTAKSFVLGGTENGR